MNVQQRRMDETRMRQDMLRKPDEKQHQERASAPEKMEPLRCTMETEMVLVFSLLKGMNFGDETVIGMRPTLARAELVALEKLGYDLEKMRQALKL